MLNNDDSSGETILIFAVSRERKLDLLKEQEKLLEEEKAAEEEVRARSAARSVVDLQLQLLEAYDRFV